METDQDSRASSIEHLAVNCELELQEFCRRLQAALNLPPFSFGGENTADWGSVESENIEYNVSRPHASGTLQEWDKTVPPGCNFGISLILHSDHPHAGDQEWSFKNLVVPTGQAISNTFRVEVYYHRTWLKAGHNVKREFTFHPKAA